MPKKPPVPTPEEHTLLMESPDLREQRRQLRLGMLPVKFAGEIRGRKREGRYEYSPVSPVEAIAPDLAKALKEKLGSVPVVKNKFTRSYNPTAQKYNIDQYVMGGNKNNKRVGATPEEQAEIDMAKMRQTQHIADRLQRESHHRMRLAEIRRAALKHVTLATRMDRPFNEDAAVWAADAIEDLGLSLREYPELTGGIAEVTDLADTVEHIGAYSAEHFEFLADNLPLVEATQLMNEKRYRYWGRLYHADLRRGRDRSTRQDRQDDVLVGQLISSFGRILPPVHYTDAQPS